jgi:xanthine dehydrogenase iron-sulfur cluster and FAD-binding subunit A
MQSRQGCWSISSALGTIALCTGLPCTQAAHGTAEYAPRSHPQRMSYNKKDVVTNRPATADSECIRVRLNSKTVVLLKSMASFASWKERYPDAQVIEPEAPKRKGGV